MKYNEIILVFGVYSVKTLLSYHPLIIDICIVCEFSLQYCNSVSPSFSREIYFDIYEVRKALFLINRQISFEILDINFNLEF